MRQRKRKGGWLLAGAALLAISLVGLAHSARAGLAQALYRSAKFGPVRHAPPEATLRRAERAHSLYSFNYFFCIWACEKAYYERRGADRQDVHAHIEAARLWCERGLALNPYNSQLQRMKTRLLARTDLRAALDHWQAYVDWYFWDPYHHAVLVDLQTKLGDAAAARDSLRWVKGSPHYAAAEAAVRAIEEPEDLDALVDGMMEMMR